MGLWDLCVKAVMRESPQDFVTWLYPGACYIGMREGQLQTQDLPESGFPIREIRTDGMIEAEYEGERFLIHVEVQSTKDGTIGRRLMGYGYEAHRLHELPVGSSAIYLFHVFQPPPSPYGWNVPGRGVQVEFKYDKY